MVFKKVKNTESTFIYAQGLALYNAELGDIVLIDDAFFEITESGFSEVNFIFNLETEITNGI